MLCSIDDRFFDKSKFAVWSAFVGVVHTGILEDSEEESQQPVVVA